MTTWTGLDEACLPAPVCDHGQWLAEMQRAWLQERFPLLVNFLDSIAPDGPGMIRTGWQEIEKGLKHIQQGISACDPKTTEGTDTLTDLGYFVREIENTLEAYAHAIREMKVE